MKILKCVGCFYFNNKAENRSLPVMCPNTHMPCWIIKPEYVTGDGLKPFINEIVKLDINLKYDKDSLDYRFPIDSQYADPKFIDNMKQAEKEIKEQGFDIESFEAY